MLKNLHDPKIDEKWSHAFPNYNYSSRKNCSIIYIIIFYRVLYIFHKGTTCNEFISWLCIKYVKFYSQFDSHIKV